MEKTKNLHIGFSHSSAFLWAIVVHAMQQKANELGIKLTTSNFLTVEDQVIGIENLIKQKIDALIVSPLISNNNRLISAIEKANAAHIPVITIGSEIGGGSSLSLIGSDHFKGQILITDYLFKHLGKKGKVAHIKGRTQLRSHTSRAQAVHYVAKEYPNIDIVFEDQHNPRITYEETGRTITRKIIAAHPDVNAIITATDRIALGAIEAIEEAGLTGKIDVIGFDGIPQALHAIKSEKLLATISQNAQNIAESALLATVDTMNGKKIPDRILTNIELVTSSNVIDAVLKTIDYVPGILEQIAEVNKKQQGLQQEVITSQYKILQTTSAISHAVRSIPESDRMTQQIVDLIRKHFNFSFVGLFLLDENENVLLSAKSGTSFSTSRDTIFLNKSNVGWCILDEKIKTELDNAELVLPLSIGEEVIGVLAIQGNGTNTFGDDDVKVLQTMTDQAAVALQNAKLYSEQQSALTFLDSLIDNLPVVLFVKDAKTLQYIRYNKAGEELYGINRNEAIGKTAADRFPKETADKINKIDQQVLETLKLIDIPEDVIHTKDKLTKILHTRKLPILAPDGTPKFLLGISEDITERKKSEIALRASEERFRDLTTLSSDWYWEQDENYCFTFHSSSANGKTDRNPQDYQGKKRWDFPALNMTEKDWAEHIKVLDARQPFYDLILKRKPDNKIIYLSISGKPIFDEKGQFRGYRGLGKNISERMWIELQQSMEHAVTRLLTETTTIREVRSKVIQKICEILGWSCGAWWDYDKEKEILYCQETWQQPGEDLSKFLNASRSKSYAPGNTGLIRRAWVSRLPVWLEDVALDKDFLRSDIAKECNLHGALAIPILDGAQVFGILEFFSREAQQPEDRILRAATSISSQIGQFCQRKKAEIASKSSEERFRSLTELSSDWYWEQDEKFRFTFISHQILPTRKLNAHDYIGKTRWEITANIIAEKDLMEHKAVLEAHLPFHDLIIRNHLPTKEIRYSSISGQPIFDSNGKFTGYRGVGRDITESKIAELALKESEERFRRLTELSSDWYWEQDENYRFTGTSGNSTTSMLRATDDIGKTRWELPFIGVTEEQWKQHKQILEERKPFYDFELARRIDNGSIRYVSISGCAIFDKDGKFIGYRGVGKDITGKKLAEERIQFLAYHDSLTALPNRSQFTQQVNHALVQAKRYKKGLAILFIDLDRFKNINDALGHEAGDNLLQQVAKRLKGCLREGDTVARLGGDEFIVLLEEVGESKYIANVARKVLANIVQPISIYGSEIQITASIGISIYPEDGQDEPTLTKNADIAMYLAKEQGKNNYQFYSAQINVHSFERLALESNLRRALQNNEFLVYYQAKIDINTNQITGMEALVRWQHPDLGLVSPAQFIPLAEETGLILPIGKWVLKTACEQNVAWQKQGYPKLRIAVNLSPRQFGDENLIQDVKTILEETGMAPELLELEITESMVMYNTDKAIKLVREMKKMGIFIAIDDFGTGYSSLALLKKFPIDTIKIDRSFIKDLPHDQEDTAITDAIINMGKALHLKIVAEGVEEKEQLNFLREHDCDEMQGFYFSKPVPNEDFIQLLSKISQKKSKNSVVPIKTKRRKNT